ncbi:MAG: tRNA 2-thiouridine(34) synthase MnmA [Candidatus Paceibacterota bacterium]|jgi:tRNA-specific 2-thiouridylase
MKKIKVVCAMSGGVDSSVSAALLKKGLFLSAGRQVDVIGIFIKFWSDTDAPASASCPPVGGACPPVGGSNKNRCCSTESENRARRVASLLGIPFYVFNFEKEFKAKIVDKFLEDNKRGITPNPCVVCNKEIKFGLLLEKAMALGADFVATGHYAVKQEGDPGRGGYKLSRPKDQLKDQTYFLWKLSQEQLKHIIFPVGEYIKPQVRALAKKFDLPVFETPESQEICFIPGQTGDFLKKYLHERPGKMIDREGNVLGEHKGLWFYTLGQRKGMGLPGGPYYVLKKNMGNNELIVTKDPADLDQKEVLFRDANWTSGSEPRLPARTAAKIRYRHPSALATISKAGGKGLWKAVFDEPQRSVTPGQSIVFYDPPVLAPKNVQDQHLLGGGIIVDE